jgi:hypothetical protein
MNWINILQIIETLTAILAKLLASQPAPGATAPAVATSHDDAVTSVTNSIATLTKLYKSHAPAA